MTSTTILADPQQDRLAYAQQLTEECLAANRRQHVEIAHRIQSCDDDIERYGYDSEQGRLAYMEGQRLCAKLEALDISILSLRGALRGMTEKLGYTVPELRKAMDR